MDSNTSISGRWKQYTDWLSVNNTDQYKRLKKHASEEDFSAFKSTIGYDFPKSLRELYEINNGGSNDNGKFNLALWSYIFLPIGDIVAKCEANIELVDNGDLFPGSSYPENAIKAMNANKKWVPFLVTAEETL